MTTKRKPLFLLLLFTLLMSTTLQAEEPTALVKNITWIENACVKISGSQTIYFDPYRISEEDNADIILITHDHGDHFSMADVNRIKGENTVIVGPACVTESLEENKRTVKAGDVIQVNGIEIRVVPSYNINKNFHPKNRGHVGFIVTMDGISYYHPGDSDFIPEMKQVQADVAFLPVCGTYMMTAEEAVEAAKAIKPKVVIPFHWGSIVGSKADAERFESLYEGRTVILEPK